MQYTDRGNILVAVGVIPAAISISSSISKFRENKYQLTETTGVRTILIGVIC